MENPPKNSPMIPPISAQFSSEMLSQTDHPLAEKPSALAEIRIDPIPQLLDKP